MTLWLGKYIIKAVTSKHTFQLFNIMYVQAIFIAAFKSNAEYILNVLRITRHFAVTQQYARNL